MNIQVQDLVCEFCKHVIRAEPVVIEQYRKEFEEGSRTCPVCTDKNGKRKFMLRLWKCGSCTQVQDDRSTHLCFCKKSGNTIKVVYDPHYKWMPKPNESILDKNMKDEIDMAKTLREVKKRIEKVRQIPLDRQVRIEKLLEKIANSVDKKEPVVKK